MRSIEDLVREALADRAGEAPEIERTLRAVQEHSRRRPARVWLVVAVAVFVVIAAVSVAVARAAPRPSAAQPVQRAGVCPGIGAAATVSGTGRADANDPVAERLAQALDAQGHGRYANIFGVLIVNEPAGRVALCVTDPGRGGQLAEAAHRADHGIDLSRLDIYRCAYSEHAAEAVIERMTQLGAGFFGYPIYGYAFRADGSGIEITTTKAGASSASMRDHLLALSAGIPVQIVPGTPAIPF